jgi:hypothetical protein
MSIQYDERVSFFRPFITCVTLEAGAKLQLLKQENLKFFLKNFHLSNSFILVNTSMNFACLAGCKTNTLFSQALFDIRRTLLASIG